MSIWGGFLFGIGLILAILFVAVPAVIILRMVENWQYKKWQKERKDDLRIIKRMDSIQGQEQGFVRKGTGC